MYVRVLNRMRGVKGGGIEGVGVGVESIRTC